MKSQSKTSGSTCALFPNSHELFSSAIAAFQFVVFALSLHACSDTVTEKISFRKTFEKQRCLIPAAGFYEWQATIVRRLHQRAAIIFKLQPDPGIVHRGLRHHVGHEEYQIVVRGGCGVVFGAAKMTAIKAA